MLWFLNLQSCMFEVVWLKILALDVSWETHNNNKNKTQKHKVKVGEDYFQEESLDFTKVLEPIGQIVWKKKKK